MKDLFPDGALVVVCGLAGSFTPRWDQSRAVAQTRSGPSRSTPSIGTVPIEVRDRPGPPGQSAITSNTSKWPSKATSTTICKKLGASAATAVSNAAAQRTSGMGVDDPLSVIVVGVPLSLLTKGRRRRPLTTD